VAPNISSLARSPIRQGKPTIAETVGFLIEKGIATSMEPFLEKVRKVVDDLEEKEQEYDLSDLCSKTKLTKSVVMDIIKKHWIQQDDLDMVFLNLTLEEENLLYEDD
jgi:hypothetical protein